MRAFMKARTVANLRLASTCKARVFNHTERIASAIHLPIPRPNTAASSSNSPLAYASVS